MIGVSSIKGCVTKIKDVLMPPMEEEFADIANIDEEVNRGIENIKKGSQVAAVATEQVGYQVANGGTVWVEQQVAANNAKRSETSRPKLTVHTNNVIKLKVQVYAPSNFDQVVLIADDLKAGKACVVNYEKVEDAEQRRICDFVNGACYVLDGTAKRISGKIVLYVPVGVDVAEAMSVAMPD